MSTAISLVIDGALVAGFGIQHSLLATLRVKARVKRRYEVEPIAWRSVESLCNVVYILVAAALWQYTGIEVWHFTGAAAAVLWTVLALSWVWYWQLHLFEYDCGLAFGSSTLVAALAGRPNSRLIPWKVGSRRWIRFPVHTAFFGMFFLIPTMTADLLVLAIVANVYNVIGSVLYDKRLERLSGEPYFGYQRVTGLIWPPVYRAPRGAVDITMPRPRHWRRPVAHLPGLGGGFAIGALYWWLLGDIGTAPTEMLLAGGVGLLASILVGLVLGTVLSPDPQVDWDQQ